MKTFENFTNLYELSKTLRFELKPIGNTKQVLEENHIIEIDKKKKESYERVKPYFNNLHLDFVKVSFENPNLNYENYFEKYKQWKKDTKNKTYTKEKEQEEKNLRKEIEKLFDSGAKKYLYYFPEVKIKKQDKDFLYEIGVFDILKKRFESDTKTHITDPETGEITTIFDNWNGWLGYFTKFFNTRKNFYKSDGTSTALATRIIDDNLKIFIENMLIFEKIKEKVNLSGLQKDFGTEVYNTFELGCYNTCFLQEGIDTYNLIIGGQTLEQDIELLNGKILKTGTKIEGINEYINKYRQNNKGEKLPYLKKLQKQILSERKESFIHQIENLEEFETILRRFFTITDTKVEYLKNIFTNLKNHSDEQYKGIYINKIAFNTLSHKFTDNIELFEKSVFESLKTDKSFSVKYDKQQNKYSFPDFIPLFFIKNALETISTEGLFWKNRYYKNTENLNGILEENNLHLWEDFCDIFAFEFQNVLQKEIITDSQKYLTVGYDIYKEKLEKVLSGNTFKLDDTSRGLIKDFADYSKVLYNFGRYFALEKSRSWNNNLEIDTDFYEGETGYKEQFYENAYEDIIVPYNLMRNYIAKKPWSDTQKWKLNFENSSLLSGWNKEIESNGAYIFKKENRYYLGVINGSKPASELLENLKTTGQNTIQRFVYDFQKPDFKNFPRLFIYSINKPDRQKIAPAVEKYNLPLDSIKEIYSGGLYKTENRGNNDYQESLEKIIDYFKLGVSQHESYKHFDFIWKKSSEYKDINEFYTDVEKSCYKPSWETLDYDKILSLVDTGKLYLFQIYNKDFELDTSLQDENYTCKIHGSKNTHTLYFESLFEPKNMENPNGAVMKLSGGGEVFFRPKAIEKKQVKRKFTRKITENKRYTEDKMFLHFPMQLNFKEDIGGSFNEKLNKFLAHNPDINIIGVDRGEKHLAYFSVINQKSEILESGSLNYIENLDKNGDPILRPEKELDWEKDEEGNIIEYILKETGEEVPYTDYALLLEVKEKNRKLQRQSWKEVEQIKDLKKGYISAVVKKLADLIIKYNAIIVFEDLNMRFKQIRGGIEKSVYQQLEKALIDKLNFLVEKNEMDSEKAGNLLKAYQLTAPVESFKDMGKQTGIIFYTQASYTSKIDPLTGWRPNLYIKTQNAEKNKENILKFDNIIFNVGENRFEITYDRKKFIASEKAQLPTKTKWTVCSCVERFRWNRNLHNNKGGYDHYKDLTHNFTELFEKYNIDTSKNILGQIETLDIKGNEKFFSDFLFLFSLVCQIRNTDDKKSGNDNDFILSPVEPFFDSRNSKEFGENLPKNGDDNGAYNIARKGIVILKRMSEWGEYPENMRSKIKYPDIFIRYTDWDNFATGKKATISSIIG